VQEQYSESFYSTIDVVVANIFPTNNFLIMVVTFTNQQPQFMHVFISSVEYPDIADQQAVEKHPSAASRSFFVIAAYWNVRIIPQDFACLASGCF
jgi:hypothetical protein